MEKNLKIGVYERNGEENTFNYYTNLRMVDKVQFVNMVTSYVVGEDYNMVLRDMMFDFTIIDIFTDVDISDITNPDNKNSINMIEDLLLETNIIDIVKANMEPGLMAELNRAVDNNIAYHTGISTNPLIESFNNLMNTIEAKISDIDIDGLTEMMKMFSDVSGELTADKIVEAYAKSDLLKERNDALLAEKARQYAMVNNTVKAAL